MTSFTPVRIYSLIALIYCVYRSVFHPVVGARNLKIAVAAIVLAGMVWMAEAIADSNDMELPLKIFGTIGISIIPYHLYQQANP